MRRSLADDHFDEEFRGSRRGELRGLPGGNSVPSEGDWNHWRSRFVEGSPSPASSAPATSAPSPELSATPSPISKEEREWIEEEAAPLATEDEKKIYLDLPSPSQRTQFRAEFWRTREKEGAKAPFGPGFKNLYETRFRLAEEKYGGWKSDQGRTVLSFGVPAQVLPIECPGEFRPIQIWVLAAAPGQPEPPRLVYYRDFEGGPWKLWTPVIGEDALRVAGPKADCRPEVRESLQAALRALRAPGASGILDEVGQLTAFRQPPENDWNQWKTRLAGNGARPSPSPIGVSPAAAEAPVSPARKLTRSDRSQLAKALPEKYREWLSDVEMIMTDAERDVFLQVKDNIERDKFIEEFWRRRSIDKDGVRTNFREVYRARTEYAKENFKNLWSDAAKVYVLNGPPDAIIPIDCSEVFVPIRIWYYERLESLRSKAYLIFYEPYGVPAIGSSGFRSTESRSSRSAEPTTLASRKPLLRRPHRATGDRRRKRNPGKRRRSSSPRRCAARARCWWTGPVGVSWMLSTPRVRWRRATSSPGPSSCT